MRAFEVMLAGRPVGTLGEEPDGRISFRFSEAPKEAPDRPVLGQRFEDNLDRTYRGRRPGELPSFFDNLIPEPGTPLQTDRPEFRGGRARRPRVARRCGVRSARRDHLARGPSRNPHNRPRRGHGVGRGDLANGRLHFSLAGVQLKFSMVREGERYVIPGRDRFGDWIVKVSSSDIPGLVENEHAMLEWARAAGFEVPETRRPAAAALEALFDYVGPDVRALALRRYDRVAGGRLHQEDFAQVMGKRALNKYDSTYDELVTTAIRVLGDQAWEEVLARLVLVVATGNADAHLKNWSLIYPDGIGAALAPVYDQVATIAWPVLREHGPLG